jgi:pre-mRNA cleavage complex 2 protein Pcf11
MSYNESSSEVAEDFRQSLEELSGNLRVEINNLTIIARENYEHAQAIADAIQDHIKKVSCPEQCRTAGDASALP